MAKLFKSNQSVSYRKLFDLLLIMFDPSFLVKSDSHAYPDSPNEVLILESKIDYKEVDDNE